MPAFILNIISWTGKLLGIDAHYFAKNSFWVSLKNGVGMLVGFGLSVAFARLISKQQYGQYTFILSTMYLVNFFSIPKFDFALSQSAARGFDQSIYQSTKASLMGSVLATLTLLLVSARYLKLGDPTLGHGLAVVALLFPLLNGLRGFDHFLIGKKRFDLSSLYAAISSVCTGLGLVLVMLFNKDVVLMILTYMLINGGLNVIFFLKTRPLVKNKKHDPDVVRYGIYLTLLALAGMVVTKIGSVLLNHFKGAEVLATYSIAIIIPKAIQNLMQNLVDVAKIKLAGRTRNDMLLALNKHGFKWLFLGLSTFIVLWFSLPILIPLIFSNKYNDAIGYAQIASLTLVFFPITTFLGTLILLEKKRKIIALSNFIPSVPNLVLYPLAISMFGIWGYIGVNLLSYIYVTPFYFWAFYRKTDL